MSKKRTTRPTGTPVRKSNKLSKTLGAGLSLALLLSPMSAFAAEPVGDMNPLVQSDYQIPEGKALDINVTQSRVGGEPATLDEDGKPIRVNLMFGDKVVGTFLLDKAEGMVVSRYVDDQGKDIAYRNVATGAIGSDYKLKDKDIRGYTLSNVKGEKTGKFQEGITEVVYQYKPNVDINPSDDRIEGTVVSKFVDQDGKEIALRQVSTGEFNTEFNLDLKEIKGYTLDKITQDGQEITKPNGRYREGIQEIVFVYNINDKANKSDPEKEAEPVKEESKTKTPKEDKKQDKNAPVDFDFTKMYDRITFDMTYDEAVSIIGKDGVKAKGGIITLDGKELEDGIIYDWTNNKGHVLSLGFAGGKLVTKDLVAGDVKKSDAATTDDVKYDNPNSSVSNTDNTNNQNNMDNNQNKQESKQHDKEKPADFDFAKIYDNLKFGMTYDEAVSIIGKKGEKQVDSQATVNGEKVIDSVVYTWKNNKGDILTLGFLNDKLITKQAVIGTNSKMDYAKDFEFTKALEERGKNTEERIASDQAQAQGQALPDTATNTYNFMAVGGGLVAVAGAVFAFINRKRKALFGSSDE